jgi:hypothetical protein
VLPSEGRKLEAGYSQIPFCALALVEEAFDQVRAAGVTGEITAVTLDPNGAYLDGAPGRVTATQPRRGELVAPGADVTVYVNPGMAVELSERDLKVIRLLEEEYAREVAEREQIFSDSPTPHRNRQPSPPVAQRLTMGLLERLDRRLTDGGARLTARWRPGLIDAQIDELLLPVGINPPEEARLWWRWHNGQQIASDGTVDTLAGRQIMPLNDSVEWYERFRGINYGAFGVDGLIPVLMQQPMIYIDCSRGFDDPVPVFTIGHGEEPELVLGSLGDLVAGMLDLIESNVWQIGPDGHVRRDHRQEKPAHLRFL